MDFIPVRAYDNYLEANMRLSMLQEENIVCHLKDEYTLTIDPLLNNALGGMKLMVHSLHLERATEILDRLEANYLLNIPCVNCGVPALERKSETVIFASFKEKLKSILINGSARPVRTYYRCSHCNHEFTTLPSIDR